MLKAQCKAVSSLGILLIGTALLLTGCADSGPKVAATPAEAIAKSKTIPDEKERLDYLITQTQEYIDQKRELEASEILEEAMNIDKWNTKELDELAIQVAAAAMNEDRK